MPNTIHKLQVPITDYREVRLPKNSKILCAQMQTSMPCIWFLCDPEIVSTETRRFHWFGTGHPMPEDIENLLYIDTVQFDGLVFHLFERTS